MSEGRTPHASHPLGRALVAEAVGTFVLVLAGVGAALMTGGEYVATGLAFGFAMVVVATCFGPVSGGHANPAISLAAALAGRLPWGRAGLYALVQVLGATAAGAALWGLMNGFPGYDTTGNLGQNSFGAAGSGFAWWAALLLELLMTAVFVGVALGVTDSRNDQPALAPVALGLALAFVHFASMGATGTSVNPARSIGVGLFAGTTAIEQLWLFVLAPLLGGLVVGVGYPLLFGRESRRAGSAVRRSRPAPPEEPGGYADPGVFESPFGRNPSRPQQWNQPEGTPYPYPYPGPALPPEWEDEEPVRPPVGRNPIHPSQRKYGPPQPDGIDRDGVSPFPPGPKEPYWSQQLPGSWGHGDDEDGRTQARPPGGH